MLEMNNVTKTFGASKALDELSMHVPKGAVYGLVGPNGAGKTTIFNCVTQFYKPTSGNVFYRDRFGSIVEIGQNMGMNICYTEIIFLFHNS